MITASIVLYNTNVSELLIVIKSYEPSQEKLLFLIDNSPEMICLPNEIKENKYIYYVFMNSNKGYGAGHNVAIRKAIELKSKYHFILNPDLEFKSDIISKIVDFMTNHPNIGLLMPKVYNTDGSIQYVCKLLPNPVNMFLRGFLSRTAFAIKMNERFELRKTGYNYLIKVPYISGCFMAFRVSSLEKIGLFDEKIFMNMEDTDISRRCASQFDTVMYPEVSIIHKWNRESHKSKKMFKQTLKSAIYYFNKYGWFFDKERKRINKIAEDFNYQKK